MAQNDADPDIRSIMNAAAASWYSQRSASPHTDHSPSVNPNGPEPAHSQMQQSDTPAATVTDAPSIGSDISAWQSALQNLPEEFRNSALPLHPLAQALSEQPTLRPVEWNQYRQQGGFIPRTPHDYSSLMIYISGQVNPNPCRNCLLKNGPFARCIVAPPTVLAQSALKHACSNCTYQNQYKKCTNAPLSRDELARSQMARVLVKKPPVTRPPAPRKPKVHLRPKPSKQDFGHIVQKPTANSISADSFAEKVRQTRSWSPRSRRRMKAEVMQWQAAIATVEAEKTRTFPGASSQTPMSGTSKLPPINHLPPQPGAAYRAPMAGTLPAPQDPSAHMGRDEYDQYGTQDPMDEDVSESDEEQEYEGTSWVGLGDTGPIIKPPQ
ncbi:Uu.00g103660.m01.CDS01 [Anthostomella pinea]|uniref:Uu.00g103660.m01.CDS01 n=1 Tax=Anthostomella pinea TaxID=933095 RepID=A0AAI8VDN1_9PEZI|nr:Uu.00g103660.m01.CDS01 [Anthostomella pinea]